VGIVRREVSLLVQISQGSGLLKKKNRKEKEEK